jgi:hypothetical protein
MYSRIFYTWPVSSECAVDFVESSTRDYTDLKGRVG